uniref:Uncharacterized protein n=2 Tax=unclassified Caudoviricetes TaxID=2788787 RepID=A0A8S5NPP7_9CAUD|nr:MAG TPA: hypothetical protein [Myoviridae sp. ctzRR1]DAD96250.1 MAG TPA: hypothetical protein [Myoviridae sp. ct0mM28]
MRLDTGKPSQRPRRGGDRGRMGGTLRAGHLA